MRWKQIEAEPTLVNINIITNIIDEICAKFYTLLLLSILSFLAISTCRHYQIIITIITIITTIIIHLLLVPAAGPLSTMYFLSWSGLEAKLSTMNTLYDIGFIYITMRTMMMIMMNDLERSIKNKMTGLLISIDDMEETHGICFIVQWDPG